MIEFDEPDQPKYVVFKQEDWVSFGGPEWMGATPVDDAVVIRLKDPFAVTALFSYANAIMTVLELMPDMDVEEHSRMVDLADYFHQQACVSQEIKGKRLPD